MLGVIKSVNSKSFLDRTIKNAIAKREYLKAKKEAEKNGTYIALLENDPSHPWNYITCD